MRSFFLPVLISVTFHLSAQVHFCGSTEAQQAWFSKHPELKAGFDALQVQAQQQNRNNVPTQGLQARTASTVSTPDFIIPIVFHILHTGGAENISDLQITDAVSILNRDYRKLNADTSVVVNAFKPLIGDVKIEFRLATLDPDGNCTNGILRHWDQNTNWPAVDFNNYIYTWDPSRYLNVYIVKSMTGGAAGYTYLPGTGIPSNGDAVVILHDYVGSIGTGNAFSSRALTHEVGHWFNLQHPWGSTNQPGVACGDDGVNDTPVTKGFSSCNLNNTQICNPGTEENIQNYMDYSYCSHMFTLDQVSRMQAAASNFVNGRNNLSTAANLASTGVTNPVSNCIPEINIAPQSFLICSGRSLGMNSYTYNASPALYTWSADNGAVISNSTLPNPSIQFNNAGNSTVYCTVSNTYGSSTESLVINVVSSVTQVTTTSSESFEGNALPPLWSVSGNSISPSIQWAATTDGASSGQVSMFVAGEQLDANAIRILQTPSYDFKNNPGARFRFYYSYAKASTTNKDVFKVQASPDCGGSWKDVWTPSTTQMANNSGGITAATFIAGASGWVQYDLSGSPAFQIFTSEENVRFRFYFQEDKNGDGYGNRLYLDDINFDVPLGINALTQSIGFSVYPNPSASAFEAAFTLSDAASINYTVATVTGAILLQEKEQTYPAGKHVIRINENKQLSPGIYFLNFEMNGVKMSRKLLVE